MGEETKATRNRAHGGDDDDEEEGEKKGVEMAPHVQRVFGASPAAVGKLLFSAPSVSLAPIRSRLFFSCPAGPASSRLTLHCILARSRALLHPSSSPRTAGPSISSPTVRRYLEEGTKRNEKNRGEKRRKTRGRTGVPTKCEIRVCQNGRWRFSLKPMGN